MDKARAPAALTSRGSRDPGPRGWTRPRWPLGCCPRRWLEQPQPGSTQAGRLGVCGKPIRARQIALEYRQGGFGREHGRIARRETLRRGEVFTCEIELTLAQVVAVAEQALSHVSTREVRAHERRVSLDRVREQRLDVAPRLDAARAGQIALHQRRADERLGRLGIARKLRCGALASIELRRELRRDVARDLAL
jgi:hypothetical protein